jgi:hypothetical protein
MGIDGVEKRENRVSRCGGMGWVPFGFSSKKTSGGSEGHVKKFETKNHGAGGGSLGFF